MLTAKELSARLGTEHRATDQELKLAGDTILGRILQRERKEYGLGQKEVAEATGIGRSHLGMIETGTAMPTVRNLAKLAQFFSVSFDYLIGHLKEESDE